MNHTCSECGGLLKNEISIFWHCSTCKTTLKINPEAQELRKVSYDKEPKTEKTETPKPKKSDFKILQDYDDDGWRLVEFRNGVQEWQHKLPTVEPEENPEVLTPFDESGLRKVRSRSTGKILYQHRDNQVPIRPLTLEAAIAYWKKIEDPDDGELLAYLCDPFGRGLNTKDRAWKALPKDEKLRLWEVKERKLKGLESSKTIVKPLPPPLAPPAGEFNFLYTYGEINHRLRELGLDRSSDRVVTYAKANGLPIKGDKVSFMETTDQQLLDLLETVKAWEKEVVKL